MPLRTGRDFGASQDFAAEVYGEQPRLRRRTRPLAPPPNEKTFPNILTGLKALTGFKPPIETPPSEAKLKPGDVLFDASLETNDDPYSAEPPTDAERKGPES